MRIISWTSWILISLVLLMVLPVKIWAFTPGSFTVSPQSVNIGTIRVLPGESAGPFTFDIGVVGGPIPDANETADFIASTDAPWLTLTPSSGTIPGSISVTASVSETMGEGNWSATVTILSGLDPATAPATVTVSMTVIRSIGDLLTVSPTNIDLVIDSGSSGQQTFPITITNADPNKTAFTWSAQTDAAWLTLSTMTGSGNTTIFLIIDPQLLPLTGDADGDGLLDAASGTVTFNSNLNPDPVSLTVQVQKKSAADLSVTPGHLYWSVEKDTNTGTFSFDPQVLQVFAGTTGWTASYDVNFLNVTAYNAAGTALGALVNPDPFGHLEVTPVASLLQGLGYGNHTGYVTVSDWTSQFHRKIPVTINIRQPGQVFTLPVPATQTYQISPYYSMVEAADASLLNFNLPVPLNLPYYPTEQLCLTAGGQWLDPDMVPGNLNEYCSLNQHIYILITFPEIAPGLVYAWTKPGQLILAYNNGIKIPGADALTYADGPVPVVPFGPFQLLGMDGTVWVSMKAGTNLTTAYEVQRLQINLQTPAGHWKVTETYNGTLYAYDDNKMLHLTKTPGQTSYSGTWGATPVTVVPGDGLTKLYQMYFSENGVNYLYEIQSLSFNQISGRWQFTSPGGSSNWETFQAQRQFWLP